MPGSGKVINTQGCCKNISISTSWILLFIYRLLRTVPTVITLHQNFQSPKMKLNVIPPMVTERSSFIFISTSIANVENINQLCSENSALNICKTSILYLCENRCAHSPIPRLTNFFLIFFFLNLQFHSGKNGKSKPGFYAVLTL